MANDFPTMTNEQIKLYERARGLYEEMNDLAAARLAKEKAYADFVGEELDFHAEALQHKEALIDKMKASTNEMMLTNQQIEKSISQEQELIAAVQERLKVLKQRKPLTDKDKDDNNEAIKRQEEMLKNMNTQVGHQAWLLELGEEGRNAKIEENKNAQYILNTEKKSIKARKAVVSTIQSGVEGMFGMRNASESVNLNLALMYATGQSMTDVIKEATGNMFTMEFAARMMQSASEKIGEALAAGFASVWDTLSALDNLSVGFSKATGEARDYKQTIADLQQTNTKYGATQAEVAGNLTELRQNFTSATKVSAETEKQLASLLIVMERNGMSAGTTTEALETFNTGLGMSVVESQAAVKDLGHLATKLGMIPDQLAKSFSKKLDTFQGAAEAAGNLNAMLGTTINSTDLLLASEGDRIKMLKDSVSMSGRSWTSLNKFEKQAIAAAAGIDDMTTANRLFGGSAAEYEKYQEEQRKAGEEQAQLEAQAKKNTQTMAKLGAAVEQISAAFTPLIDLMRTVADFMAKHTVVGTTLIYTLLGVYAAAKMVAAAMFIKAIRMKVAAAGSIAAAAADHIGVGAAGAKARADAVAAKAATAKASADRIAGNTSLVSSTQTATGTTMMGTAAAMSAPQMLALGFAVLMIGGAIALVILAFTGLIEVMAENALQLTAFVMGLALLGLTGMFAAVSIGAIALAFGGLALALALIKTADLQAMGDIFNGIGNIGGDTASALSDIGSAIKEFAELADDIDFDKMIGIEWFVAGLSGVNAIDPVKLKATSEVIASAAEIKPGAGAALQEIAGGFLELTLGSLFITESKLDKLADVIRAATGQAGGGGGTAPAAADGGSDVVLVLNERELGRAIDVHMENKLSFTKVQSS